MGSQIVSKLDHPHTVKQIGGGIAAAVVLGVVMIGLVGTALLLPPFSIVQRWQRRSEPSVLMAGAQISALSSPPSAEQPTDNRDLPATMAPIATTFRLAAIDTATSTLHTMQVIVDVPNGFRESAVDIAIWTEGAWQVLPSTPDDDGAQRMATVTTMPARVALVQLTQIAPLVSIVLEQGQVLRPELREIADVVEPAGMTPDAQGNLTGMMPNGVATGQGYDVMPIIRCEDAALLTQLLTNPALQEAHLNALIDFATSQPYAGLAIEYRGLPSELQSAFTAFLQRLAVALTTSKRTLTVMLTDGNEAYDWTAIGQIANAVQVRAGKDDVSFSAAIRLIVSRISRAKVQIILTSDVADTLDNQIAILSAANLAGVGVAEVAVDGDTSTVARVITPYKLPAFDGLR